MAPGLAEILEGVLLGVHYLVLDKFVVRNSFTRRFESLSPSPYFGTSQDVLRFGEYA
jgi:hypothetical protein